MLLVREVSGPESARVGETLVYTATRFNLEQPDAAELAAVNWVVKQSEKELARGQGPSFSFTPGVELAGSAIITMAYRNSPSPSVSSTTYIRPLLNADGFREQLKAIGESYPDLLNKPPESSSLQELVSTTTALRYDLEDLLESLGPLATEDSVEFIDEDEEHLDRPRLAIVVGHTANRPGAVAGPPIDQQEYTWNCDLAEMIKVAAADEGLDTKICLRDGVGITGAYAAAEAFQPRAIIELHFNSFSNPAARGTETLYASVHPASEHLASLVQERMLVALGPGQQNRGIKLIAEGGRGYRNLSAVDSIPSVLVEPFFGSNNADCQAANANKAGYAQALVAASLAFLAT